MIPLSVPCLKGNELKYVSDCIESEWVSSAGQYVNRFEECFRNYIGSRHAVACSSGTAALHIALLLQGVSAGHEVIVPTLTFIATINAIKYVGAEPVFMDCDEYLNIDSAKVSEFCEQQCSWSNRELVNRKSGRIVKAILPVHVFGHPVDMLPLMGLAEKYGIALIEDATESLGSHYSDGALKGKRTGTLGAIGCFSFNGNKIITTGGGGMIVTDSDEVAKRARYLTTQAKDDEQLFIHNEVGFNYRLTNIQAALGVAQMEQIDEYVSIKRRNYAAYRTALLGYPAISFVDEPSYAHSNYWHYSMLIHQGDGGKARFDIMEGLTSKGVQTRPLWKLNHLQLPYRNCQSFKIEKAPHYYDRLLNIPCSVGLTRDELDYTVKCISELM